MFVACDCFSIYTYFPSVRFISASHMIAFGAQYRLVKLFVVVSRFISASFTMALGVRFRP